MNPEHQAELEYLVDLHYKEETGDWREGATQYTGAWNELVSQDCDWVSSDDWVDLCSRALVEVQQVQTQRIIRYLESVNFDMSASAVSAMFLEDE